MKFSTALARFSKAFPVFFSKESANFARLNQ